MRALLAVLVAAPVPSDGGRSEASPPRVAREPPAEDAVVPMERLPATPDHPSAGDGRNVAISLS